MGLRDNKLLRSKLQAQAKSKHNENQATPDEQLTRLEEDVKLDPEATNIFLEAR